VTSPQKKGLQGGCPAALLRASKGNTRATNATPSIAREGPKYNNLHTLRHFGEDNGFKNESPAVPLCKEQDTAGLATPTREKFIVTKRKDGCSIFRLNKLEADS